ncbi:MAG: hypothetical protein AB1631_03160 [Acidobacteriota bacterium]
MKKNGLCELPGKTIKSVIVSEGNLSNPPSPLIQVYLIFTEGTSFEFYGESILAAGSVENKDEDAILDYVKHREASTTHIK